MKRILLLEICFLILATTFQSDRMTGWVQQFLPNNAPIVDIQFLDSLTGFVISRKTTSDSSYIFKTTNGGDNWFTPYQSNIFLSSVDFIDKNTGYCVGATNWALVLKTTNGGDNWFALPGFTAGQLNDVVFVNNDTGWVCSTHSIYGGLWRTSDGGLSWQQEMNASYKPQRIFFVNSNTGWVIGNSGYKLYKTTDCGTSWATIFTFIDIASDVFFTSSDSGWVVKSIWPDNKSVVKSTNGGYNWDSVNIPVISYNSRLYFVENNKGWVGSETNKIYATKDGYNWGNQLAPITHNFTIWFADSLHGWAGYGGLVHTTDGGGPITYVGIKKNGNFVPSFELGQNYPNPFNPSTRIRFSVYKPCNLELTVFSPDGREIARLMKGRQFVEGDYSIEFDAGDYPLGSGVYFYRMLGITTNNKEIFIDTKKMILVK